jgi:hypothetical protein
MGENVDKAETYPNFNWLSVLNILSMKLEIGFFFASFQALFRHFNFSKLSREEAHNNIYIYNSTALGHFVYVFPHPRREKGATFN